MDRSFIFDIGETGSERKPYITFTTAANINFGKPCPCLGIIQEEA